MASVASDPGGRKRILFFDANGKRQPIRLGECTRRQAETVAGHVDAIVASQRTRGALPPETAEWLKQIPDAMTEKLAAVELIAARENITVRAFLEKLFAKLTCKPGTAVAYGHSRKNLEQFLDPENNGRMVRSVGTEDADGWRAWLVDHEKLSPATVSRRVIAARQFWKLAIRWRYAAENPFTGVKAGQQSNEERKCFVSCEVIDAVIDAASDPEWKVLIALSRYAGLRIPSEALPLRWSDIDWERGRMHVRSPKTEHHAGGESRTVPLFPELRGHLLTLFEAAEPGSVYVITRYRDTTQNLRTQFQRIIRRAGQTPWPKLWHNLRASRETELMRQYDLATVCRWIGNSPTIAARHYATSVDLNADFRKATGLDRGTENSPKQAAHFPAHNTSEMTGNELHTVPESSICDGLQPLATHGDGLMGAAGFEPA